MAALLRTPTLIDCGAEGHIVKSKHMLSPNSIKPSNMVTEAFSGARAPITHTGDHISGLFPNCHVVPQSVFNLFAVGPHLDSHPDYAIVLSATLALQLVNVDFNKVAKAPDPRRELSNCNNCKRSMNMGIIWLTLPLLVHVMAPAPSTAPTFLTYHLFRTSVLN